MDDNKVGSHRLVGVSVSQEAESRPRRPLTGRRGMPLPGIQVQEAARKSGGRPDSWFASNGTALSRFFSTLEFDPQLSGSSETSGVLRTAASIPETIIGSDDRQRIFDTLAVPYAWICDL